MSSSNVSAPALQADKLGKTYGDKTALDALELKLANQGVTAILGPNGAGKTTLIHCALGLTRPSSGTLSVLSATPGSMALRRRIGVMLQDADLPDLLTAREHINLFASYYPNPLPVDEVLTRCDISAFADKRYKKLSGGQKRRVQFALAIVGQPDLIFLDEPTTGLDIDARRILWDVVRELAEAGKTIVLTTHYLEEADALADRIVVLSVGGVIADGPAEDIRNTVGGSLIRCVTRLPDAALAALAQITSVRRAGRYVEAMSRDATQSLTALLAADPEISDLTIKKPNLEEAFLALTHGPEGDRS